MSPVSNTSARRGPGRNRTFETLLRRPTQRLSHLTMGSRYQSQTALFGPKTVSHPDVTASSPPSFRAEKCAKGLEKRVHVLVAREVELRDIFPHSHSCQHACLGRNRTSETSLRRPTQRLSHLTMGFGPKTLINYVTALSPLSLGPKSAQKGLEKRGRLRGFGLRAELFSTEVGNPTAPH